MVTDTQTHTHTHRPSTVTLAADACRRLMKRGFKARSSAPPNYRNGKPEFKATVGLWCLLQCYFC